MTRIQTRTLQLYQKKTYRNLGSGDLDNGDRDLDLDIGDRRSCITFRGGGNGLKLRLLDLFVHTMGHIRTMIQKDGKE